MKKGIVTTDGTDFADQRINLRFSFFHLTVNEELAGGANRKMRQSLVLTTFLMILLGLAACAPSPQAGEPSAATLPAATEASAQSPAAATTSPTSTPVEATPTTEPPTPTPTPTLEPAQTPTPEATPVPPEIPYTVEEGLVMKWAVNPQTNQSAWVVDESFPEIGQIDGRTVVIERVAVDQYGVFGAFSQFYDELVAINSNGAWQIANEVDPAQFISSEFAPGTLSFANPEWSQGRTILEAGAIEAYRALLQTIINQNPHYFRWLTGSNDMTLANALAARENHDGLWPLPPEESGVRPIRLVAPGPRGPAYISHDPKRGAEIDQPIDPTGIGFILFSPEEWDSNFALQLIFGNVSEKHVLSYATLELYRFGLIMIGDKLVYVHGMQEYNKAYNPSVKERSRLTGIGDPEKGAADPEKVPYIVSAFLQAYLEALRAGNEGNRMAPLNNYYRSEYDIVTGGRYGPPVTQPAFIQ